ncbi:MAG TPA: DUF4062 domain-containing protein [Pyrinomonadaceae bacterium]
MKTSANATKWRVFISSTSRDLQSERGALERALHQLVDAEFNGMEYFGSRPDAPKQVCLQEVSRSDVYVGVFADRYGFIDPETETSMTEVEYRQARKDNIPCLIYLKDGSGPAAAEQSGEESDRRDKLEALRQELQREHIVTFYKNPDHLATRVILDLHNLIRESRLPSPTSEPSPNELRLVLSLQFDLEELRDLCFAVGVDFDNLRGEGKGAKARELVLYMQRRGGLGRLFAQVAESRPDIGWR